MLRVIPIIIVLALVSLALTLGLAQSPAEQGASAKSGATTTLRIGTYDNRTIGIAFAASKFNPTGAKMKEYETAKAAGDAARVQELKAWGEDYQRQLNRQGFGRVPVTDLLEPVKHQLPALATKLGVDAIAFECNYTATGTETVDVTMELVKLYEPSEQAMKWAAESLKSEPVDLDEIDRVKN